MVSSVYISLEYLYSQIPLTAHCYLIGIDDVEMLVGIEIYTVTNQLVIHIIIVIRK